MNKESNNLSEIAKGILERNKMYDGNIYYIEVNGKQVFPKPLQSGELSDNDKIVVEKYIENRFKQRN